MSAAEPRLSVVIPCLNVAPTLPDQLAALAAQEVDVAWEVVIADNGSTDDTVGVARSFTDRLPALRVVSVPRRGRHHACNAGARAAAGDLLVFVDGDDEVAPGFLQAMADALECHGVAAGRLQHPTSGYGHVQTHGLREGFGFLPAASGGCLGVQRQVFLSVGGFVDGPAYGEDVDLSWRLQLAGHRIAFVPQAVVAVRQRDDLMGMFRQHRNFGQAQVALYREYRGYGMPRRSVGRSLGEWWKILRGALRASTPDERARFVRRLGRAVGRLCGSVRHRVLYL